MVDYVSQWLTTVYPTPLYAHGFYPFHVTTGQFTQPTIKRWPDRYVIHRLNRVIALVNPGP